MKVLFSERFTRSFRQAPDRVQREFGKQLGYLLRDLRPFPSAPTKYDKTGGTWQARVGQNWRFYVQNAARNDVASGAARVYSVV